MANNANLSLGRPKGSHNKATVDVKAAFAKRGPELVKALLALCKHEDPNVQLRALSLAYDRWLGKAPSQVDVSGEVAVSRIERIIVDDAKVIDAPVTSVLPKQPDDSDTQG